MAITKEKLKHSINEAKRFLERANELLECEEHRHLEYYSYTKQCGAVRRASMDLTRSLAELRKS